MDEFGLGSFSTSSPFGVPRNPYDSERSCGGPTGGAAAAAASIEGHIALGSGPSLSGAASFCGVIGLSPGFGRVSRHGLMESSSSLDRVGLFSRQVEPLAAAYALIAGPDPRDPFTLTQSQGEMREPRSALIVKESLEGLSAEASLAFQEAADRLRSLGLKVEEGEAPEFSLASSAQHMLGCIEASTALARYCGLRYGVQSEEFNEHYDDYFTRIRTEHLGREAKKRIMTGTYARTLGAPRRLREKALYAREMVIDRHLRLFESHDLLLTPATVGPAPRLEEAEGISPLEAERLSAPGALAGLPQLSLPCGMLDGMPLGIQLTSPYGQEGMMLELAQRWEESSPAPRPEVKP